MGLNLLVPVVRKLASTAKAPLSSAAILGCRQILGVFVTVVARQMLRHLFGRKEPVAVRRTHLVPEC